MDTNMFVEDRVNPELNFTAQLNGTPATVNLDFLQESPESQQRFIISLVLSSLYTVFLFPVGFIGNILILLVNLHHGGRLSAPDLYFVNLAVADLALVADSLIEVFNLKKGYYDVPGLCTFMNLFQQANMYSSVFFLTWMSYDRFVALTGLRGRSMPRARLCCCLIWVSSSMLTLVPFVVAQRQHAEELSFCFANLTQVQWLEVTLGFLVPFCVLGLCYWKIARVLWQSQREKRPGRQKALRMIAAAVLVFFLCWLPENAFISIHLLRGDTDGGSLWQDYPLTGHSVRLAAFSNSCLNPLIYSFLGGNFRAKLRFFLRKSRCSPLQRRSTEFINAQVTSNRPRQSTHFSPFVLPQTVLFPLCKSKLHTVYETDIS